MDVRKLNGFESDRLAVLKVACQELIEAIEHIQIEDCMTRESKRKLTDTELKVRYCMIALDR